MAGEIKLWEVRRGKRLRTLRARDYARSFLAWRPDGDVLASGSDKCDLKLWEVRSGKVLALLQATCPGR